MATALDDLKKQLADYQSELNALTKDYNNALFVVDSLKTDIHFNNFLLVGNENDYKKKYGFYWISDDIPGGDGFYYPANSNNPNWVNLGKLETAYNTTKTAGARIAELKVMIEDLSRQINSVSTATVKENISNGFSSIVSFITGNVPLIVSAIFVLVAGLAVWKKYKKKSA